MKIGLFTDPHYSSAALTCGVRKNSLAPERIRCAYDCFAREGCDLAICLGDLTDSEPDPCAEAANLRHIAAILDDAPMPSLCLMGNHDAFSFTEPDFYALLGPARRPRSLTFSGVTLLFLDACHFHTGLHYAPGDTDWTDTFYPFPHQLAQSLQEISGEVWLFLHQNLDPAVPANHRLSNDAHIRRILEESGKVTRVWQGHYHPGCSTLHRGIQYHTLPALCENETAFSVISLPE